MCRAGSASLAASAALLSTNFPLRLSDRHVKNCMQSTAKAAFGVQRPPNVCGRNCRRYDYFMKVALRDSRGASEFKRKTRGFLLTAFGVEASTETMICVDPIELWGDMKGYESDVL
jgi:hypothetical protein